MSMKPGEFLEMRPADFWLKLRGFRMLREDDFRATAEMFRMQTTDLINIQLEKRDRMKPTDLWKFPWDKEEVAGAELVTEEENEEAFEKMISILPGNKLQ